MGVLAGRLVLFIQHTSVENLLGAGEHPGLGLRMHQKGLCPLETYNLVGRKENSSIFTVSTYGVTKTLNTLLWLMEAKNTSGIV